MCFSGLFKLKVTVGNNVHKNIYIWQLTGLEEHAYFLSPEPDIDRLDEGAWRMGKNEQIEPFKKNKAVEKTEKPPQLSGFYFSRAE